MKFTLSEAWSWDYIKVDGFDHLALNLVSDQGERFYYITTYQIGDLREFPNKGQAFCIEDARLLTAFQDGFYEINVVSDEIIMPLSLNALACARFVRLPNPSGGRMYLPYGSGKPIHLGQIVSLYAKDGGIGDFIVLDEMPDSDVYRLMLINKDWDLGRYRLLQGSMVRVSSQMICHYRSIPQDGHTVRYA